MVDRVRALRLRGREREQRLVARLLDGARSGRGRALVLRGEPGIGKSALLQDTLRKAGGFGIAHVRSAESEFGFAYAGLHQLCTGAMNLLPRLREPQRAALRIAFGMADGPAPDHAMVTLAITSLLRESAADRPVLCVLDDAQWLDEASLRALASLARSIQAFPAVMIFAFPDPAGDDEPAAERELAGLPVLRLPRLGDKDARALLTAAMPYRFDEPVRDRILAEARGNPLALLELHRGLSPDELAGGFGSPEARPVVDQIERSFIRQVRQLPEETRRLLLIAAADPTGDGALLRRAADSAGVGLEAETDLVTIGDQVWFRHPLVRSAIYRAAPLSERRWAHQALATALDTHDDDARRTWHRAHAAGIPDEVLAGELEQSAERARARGGTAAAAAFLTRAAGLTPDPARRVDRILAAAQAKLEAGAPAAAWDLLVLARAAPLDGLRRLQVDSMCARVGGAAVRGSDAQSLLAAAARLARFDPILSRETYFEAMLAAIFSRHPVSENERPVVVVARAARAAPPAPRAPRALDLLLDALVVRFTEGYVAAAPALRRALDEFLREDAAGKGDIRGYWLCAHLARDLFDTEGTRHLAVRQVEVARAAGSLRRLPRMLAFRATIATCDGLLEVAEAALEESDAITSATGASLRAYVQPFVAAWRSDEERALELHRDAIARATEAGEGQALRGVHYTSAVFHNSLGQYSAALTSAREAGSYDGDLGTYGPVQAEIVEAAARCGENEEAAEALRRLVERTDVTGTDTAIGIAARSRALLTTGPAAEALYRKALAHLERATDWLWLARTHLVYGEWLRRANRRVDARAQLRAADEQFTRMNAAAFAARARRELVATAESVRGGKTGASDGLTAHEDLVARLARDGQTNQEIAAQLVISARTVEWHLNNIFAKLGIHSRRQLREVLPAD